MAFRLDLPPLLTSHRARRLRAEVDRLFAAGVRPPRLHALHLNALLPFATSQPSLEKDLYHTTMSSVYTARSFGPLYTHAPYPHIFYGLTGILMYIVYRIYIYICLTSQAQRGAQSGVHVRPKRLSRSSFGARGPGGRHSGTSRLLVGPRESHWRTEFEHRRG